MTSIRLPHIHRFRDRHGHVRHYYRRPGVRVALPGAPGSAEFLAAYERAARAAPGGPVSAQPRGSFDALAASYLRSARYRDLRPSTKRVYARILAELRQAYGPLPVAQLTPRHVRSIVARKDATPAAANRWLSILRLLMARAIEAGEIEVDPTRDVKRRRELARGHHSWSEEEIARFEARHPIGTAARLALILLLYTGQRRSDVVTLGPSHVRDGRISLRQAKTGQVLSLPMHEQIRVAIAASATGVSTYLVTAYGRPFTAAGFGGWFRARCDEAGLPQCTAHGLRKAAARRLAEAGCSAHEIASVTGHETLAEVQRYAKAADQRRLSDAAFRRMGTDAG